MSIDCGGKDFYCPTINSFLLCADQPDGSTRTISTLIQYCHPDFQCDHNNGEFECDSPISPTTTEGNAFFNDTIEYIWNIVKLVLL